MFSIVRSNNSFNFPLGLIKYIVVVVIVYINIRHKLTGTWLIVHYVMSEVSVSCVTEDTRNA